MLPKIRALIVHSELTIQRTDRLFSKKDQEHRNILSRLVSLGEETEAIIKLSRSLYPSGEINKDKLFGIQRRQGALKRKLADIKMQTSQIILERDNCENEKYDIAERRKKLNKKMNKYQYLQNAERKQKQRKDTRIEEYETEERLSWQR
ncbi:hypothetical protein [Yersinia kristensenii]|uniref:hypothetical protein n=1 Tax=Yersinia kristensenii TaxID=28152 RepID=UPI0005E7E47B|nr:hypothetical protein [Yersinia kristensenii]CNF34888.1 Uncharacterised protein [Yersinia kristensenii]